MSKLELKHLAPYLSHGFRIKDSYNGQIHRIEKGGTLDYVLICYNWENPNKIILHPMSDLTKEELIAAGFNSHVDYLTDCHQDEPNRFKIENAPYKMVEYLISKHYDVFNLIDQNLAIDINTLNNE